MSLEELRDMEEMDFNDDSDAEDEGEEMDDDIEVEDPLELITRLFQTEEGENVCDVLSNVNDSIREQTQVMKYLVKMLQVQQRGGQQRAQSLKK